MTYVSSPSTFLNIGCLVFEWLQTVTGGIAIVLGFDVAPRHIDVFSRHSLCAVAEYSLEAKRVAPILNICERE